MNGRRETGRGVVLLILAPPRLLAARRMFHVKHFALAAR